ncbi:DNA-directed RNA polymerase III subunit RPC10 [Mycena kentingensis (nom. inval.)]|nr:DNA-directed RNA polymerase III subunit RPC10 [Mycena kentingensis (nom. inval.)]
MLFCPTCSNILAVNSATGYNKWACNTCPYEFPITKQVCTRTCLDAALHVRRVCCTESPALTLSPGLQMTSRTKLVRKAVDDVLGGEEAWKDADATMASCPKCNNDKAYFYQLQIRSADEPMTTCILSLYCLCK